MPDECSLCGSDTASVKRCQSRGVIIETRVCPTCGDRQRQAEAIAGPCGRPPEAWPPIAPEVRCDACGRRGSLRVRSARLERGTSIVRNLCRCIACGYDQQHLEKAVRRRG